MKKLLVILISLLVLVPQAPVHADVVVHSSIENHIDLELDNHLENHQHPSGEHNSTEHHHHCSNISMVHVFLQVQHNFNLSRFSDLKEKTTYYTCNSYTSHLSTIFLPPKF